MEVTPNPSDSQASFAASIATLTDRVAGRMLDERLTEDLERMFPSDGEWFAEMKRLCIAGCEEGWLCSGVRGKVRFGRVIEPSAQSAGFSVDVVEMDDVAGMTHRHPAGEIVMIMPLEGDARFDGKGIGWKVYKPESSHAPTVTGGKALVLYLLPGGEIDFQN